MTKNLQFNESMNKKNIDQTIFKKERNYLLLKKIPQKRIKNVIVIQIMNIFFEAKIVKDKIIIILNLIIEE